MIWFAVLLMMAGFLGEFGLIAWISERTGGLVGGRGWVPAFLLLSLIYFYSHYFFASNTAHVSAMYAHSWVSRSPWGRLRSWRP